MTDSCGIWPDRLEKHLRHLTVDIGVRLAGSASEDRAVAYIKEQFEETGALTSVESFGVFERVVTREFLEVRIGGRWQAFPGSLFSSTPGTEGETIEAPICFFEAATEYQRRDLSHLKGKAVVHLGCHIESRDNYRRLMAAEPAFLLFVDVRYPGDTPRADGMFPAYTRALGAKPTVNVAYMDAWRWKAEGASHARLAVDGGMRPSVSHNVIAEIPGSDPEAGILFASGHHDTQADSVGADDNASGVAAVIEMARALAPLKLKRTIRLISFGAEEQLSVGSAEYVRAHRAEVESLGRFTFNLDSYASLMGWSVLVCSGPGDMEKALAPHFEAADLCVRMVPDVVPYTDQFPFAAAGVPGVYLGRQVGQKEADRKHDQAHDDLARKAGKAGHHVRHRAKAHQAQGLDAGKEHHQHQHQVPDHLGRRLLPLLGVLAQAQLAQDVVKADPRQQVGDQSRHQPPDKVRDRQYQRRAKDGRECGQDAVQHVGRGLGDRVQRQRV